MERPPRDRQLMLDLHSSRRLATEAYPPTSSTMRRCSHWQCRSRADLFAWRAEQVAADPDAVRDEFVRTRSRSRRLPMRLTAHTPCFRSELELRARPRA